MERERLLFSSLDEEIQGCIKTGDSIESKGMRTIYVSKWYPFLYGQSKTENRFSLIDYKNKRWKVTISRDNTGYYLPIWIYRVNKNKKKTHYD